MYDSIAAAPDNAGLFAQATDQAGYFTSAQAQSYGYSRQLLSHHAASGRFLRIRHGLYRFRDYPPSLHEEVMAAWLAVGKDTAVVSHESALDLLDLSDVVPNAVHILVPRARRSLLAWPGVALHTTTRRIDPQDIVTREGMRVTAPARTILDAAETGTASEQVVRAVMQARARGWITAPSLRELAHERGERVERLIDLALRID